MKRTSQKGFTLLEVLIVIVVIGVLTTVAGYMMGNQGSRAQLKSAARDMASNMNLTRVRAIRDGAPWAIEFDPAAGEYRILSDWGGADQALFRTVPLPPRVTFNSNPVDQDPGPPIPSANNLIEQIIFNRDGSCSAASAIYFWIAGDADLADSNYAVSVLQATGRVKIQRGGAAGWSN